MPTLVACASAAVLLVVTVGLQEPAASVGLRWVPTRRPLRPIELEPLDLFFGPITTVQDDDRWPFVVAWALAALVTLAIVVAVARWLRRVMRRAPMLTVTGTGAASGVTREANAAIVQSGLAAALDILNSNRTSSDAVVLAWQGLEDAAAAAGLDRRPAETASEFTARILYRSRGSSAPIAVLLSLYQRVRFGHHVPEPAEIAAARDSLATLVELWQADFRERRPTRGAR